VDDCAKFEELQSAWLDGQLAPDEQMRIAAHLDVCPQCSVDVEQLARTRLLLRSMPVRQVPAGLFDGLEVARMGDSEPRPSWTFAGSTEAYPRDDLEVEPPSRGHQSGHVAGRVMTAFAVVAGLVGGAAFGLGGQPEGTPQLVQVPVDVYAVDHFVQTVGLPLSTPALGS
jgi:anti-sigma factor RsiW